MTQTFYSHQNLKAFKLKQTVEPGWLACLAPCPSPVSHVTLLPACGHRCFSGLQTRLALLGCVRKGRLGSGAGWGVACVAWRAGSPTLLASPLLQLLRVRVLQNGLLCQYRGQMLRSLNCGHLYPAPAAVINDK